MLQMFAAGATVLMITLVQAPPPRAGAAAKPTADLPVVLSGCLVATAETDAEHKDAKFMLINAGPAPAGADQVRARDPEAGTTGVGTTGTGTSGSGASASPTTAQDTAQVTVLLTAGSAIGLGQHVNHRVEVHGTISGGPLSTTSKGAQSPKADDEPRQVQVTKVRRLSGPCSGKK